MAKQKNDNAQVRQSKEWLTSALWDMMRQKPYNQITIQDIAVHAELDRRTFYRHFSSKEDILDQYLLSLLIPYFDGLQNAPLQSEYELTCSHFNFLQTHIDTLLLLKKQGLFGYLLGRYQDWIHLLRARQKLAPITEPEELLRLAFKTGGFFSVVSQWLEGDPVKPPEEMAQIIQHFMENGLSSLCTEEGLLINNEMA